MPATSTAFTDRYGLPLSTTSSVAAECYVEALDLILSGNLGAEERLAEAMQADEGFALPHAALATLHLFYGRLAEARAERARGTRHLSASGSRRRGTAPPARSEPAHHQVV